jgi:hypothetical protein
MEINSTTVLIIFDFLELIEKGVDFQSQAVSC